MKVLATLLGLSSAGWPDRQRQVAESFSNEIFMDFFSRSFSIENRAF